MINKLNKTIESNNSNHVPISSAKKLRYKRDRL